MRKKNIVLYTVIVLAFTMVIAPLVTAKPKTRLNGDVWIEFQPDFDPPSQPYSFIGAVSGDIEGVLYVALIEAWFPAPGVEHFIEEWRIVTATGDIEGVNKGKWTMSNFKWVANGEVTSASGDWEHLVGSKWQYSGTTGDPNILPLLGYGKWMITHNK